MSERAQVQKELTFREGMDKLEGIVGELEAGTLELEESLEKYAEGVKLLSQLQSKLAKAQQKIDVLMGELEEAPADEVQDAMLLNE